MSEPVDVDVVVIGSGAGGLAAALALAQAGKKVLVVEQHYLPGGWCHSFTLSGYRFSPGVHYIGELQPGGRMRAFYEGLGLGGDLEFCELNPDGYDHIFTGGERFDIPAGKQRFADALAARFPGERRGITRYLDTVDRISRELGALTEVRGLLGLLSMPLRAPAVTRWGLRPASALIDAHVSQPRLKAILAAQAGDYGLPPSMAPAALHAAVSAHYFDGGWYPRGGAYALPRAFIRGLRRAGGTIRVRTAVERILVERGRAIGVRLAGGEEVRAGLVVSNADPQVTFGRLMDHEHVPGKTRKRLARARWSVSALSLFCATDLDVGALGLDSGNYWWYQNDDIDGIYRKGLDGWGAEIDELPGMFLTVTTLKDPSKRRDGHHTIEAFTFVGWDAYKKWASSRYGERPADYAAMKDALKARMLSAASRIVPGLEDHVVFSDLGTPLTNLHYCAATEGNLYGTAKTRDQIGPWAWPLRTDIDGLWMCGASTLGHGVLGATMSGLAAAAGILGCRVSQLLGRRGGSIRLYRPGEAPTGPAGDAQPDAEASAAA